MLPSIILVNEIASFCPMGYTFNCNLFNTVRGLLNNIVATTRISKAFKCQTVTQIICCNCLEGNNEEN